MDVYSICLLSLAAPTVFPTGVTIYKPDKCYNGYTFCPIKEGRLILMDMNGRIYLLLRMV